MCRAGANKDQPNTNGAIPLYTAAQNNHAALVQLLCHGGADLLGDLFADFLRDFLFVDALLGGSEGGFEDYTLLYMSI